VCSGGQPIPQKDGKVEMQIENTWVGSIESTQTVDKLLHANTPPLGSKHEYRCHAKRTMQSQPPLPSVARAGHRLPVAAVLGCGPDSVGLPVVIPGGPRWMEMRPLY
jgi:hypothetical protein